jgi:hypothetical protein
VRWGDRARAAAAILALLALSPLILVGLAIAPFVLAWDRWQAHRLRRRFESKWQAAGKTGLLVYSNSPHWQEYVQTRWLPHLSDRMVVLNWSEREQWPDAAPLEARVHRQWAGDREFNPVAIVFRDGMKPDVVRFWKAFRDYRHGKSQPLRAAERELAGLMNAPGIVGETADAGSDAPPP